VLRGSGRDHEVRDVSFETHERCKRVHRCKETKRNVCVSGRERNGDDPYIWA